MPSLPHDAVLALFRHRPSLAPELLRDTLHVPVAAFDSVRVAEADVTQLIPTEFRADMVLLLEPTGGGHPSGALVIEIQRDTDSDKFWSWPTYLAGLRSRHKCDVCLLVVADDAVVARWAARPIPMGHPGWALTPLVLGPDNVPLVTSEDDARRAPELAVLSVIVHAHHSHIVHVARAALAGARNLDEERAALYLDVVFASVPKATRSILEALMTAKTYEYQSDFAKRYVAQGEARGRAEGEARGEAKGVLTVLAARGIAVPDELRARILSCSDLTQLDRWLTRAATATSAADVVSE